MNGLVHDAARAAFLRPGGGRRAGSSVGDSRHDYRRHIERIVAQVTAGFLNVPAGGLAERILETLRVLGEFADVDRCYVFDLDDGGALARKTAEWDATGAAPIGPPGALFPVQTWPWAWPLLARGQVVRVERLDDLPPEAAVEKARWQRFGLRSLLVVPIRRDDRFAGVLGFESVRRENVWSEDDLGLLTTVAEVFGQAHARYLAEERLREMLRRARRQQVALRALATHGAVARGDLAAALPAIAAASAGALEVAQVGIWFLSGDRQRLRCEALHANHPGQDAGSLEVDCVDYPAYFAALRATRVIDAHDARTDHRTREFTPGYLVPAGITSLLDAAILLDGEVVGVVCHEHRDTPRTWTADEISFAGSVADLVAQALLAHQRRRAEQALVEARDAAEAASRAKSEFLANMSHEIRTPLNSIIGCASLLSEADLGPQERDLTEMIRHSGEALLSLIGDVLDFARIEAGRLHLDPVPTDLERALRLTVGALSVMAREKGLALELSWLPDAPRCLVADEARLRQVVINLVGNALKFTHAGGVTVTVGCAGRAGDLARLRVEVRDTGIGIPAAMRDRVFEKFTQIDGSATRRYGGSGLGLTICRELIALMGGEIGVESEAGRGSTFWFEVPLPVAAAGACDEPPASFVDDGSLVGARLLLAEDNPFNQRVATMMLQRLGCRVDLAADGREALARAAAVPYDLILMDCQMPEMDGYAAAAALRAREGTGPRVPIVALTAHALAGDRERCLGAGMDDYLTKPLRPEALREVLVRWLGARAPAGACV